MKRTNKNRRAKLYARNFGAEAEALRELPCVVASHGKRHRCSGPIQMAHVVARGMGGAKGGRFDVVPLCAKAHANSSEARTPKREVFELHHEVDLRAQADRLALEHERPLGILGLADRWVELCGAEFAIDDETGDILQLSAYERAALLGWVRREMAREVERRTMAAYVGAYERRAYAPLGRDALAHHIAQVLGGAFVEDLHGEHGLAWTLCEEAGWPS
jgi:hypothetical protein